MKKKYSILLIIFILFFNKNSFADYDLCIKYFQNKEYQSSFDECKKLAINGDNKAINHLAYMFFSGELPNSIKKNTKKAIRLYKISADNGNAKAQYNLGIFASKGVGLKKNILDAAFWFTLSSSEIEKAKNELDIILLELSSLEKDELSIRIEVWNNRRDPEKDPTPPDYNPPVFLPDNLELVSYGTGFFINPSSMITNHHVIDQCKAITIMLKNKRVLAKVINFNEYLDLALLDVNYKNNYVVKLENNKLELGEKIIVVGFPLADRLNTNIKVTDGLVSSLFGINNDPDRLTHTAPTQPGNSGGPVFSEKGTVIAVIMATYSHADIVEELGGYIPQNINFAIKGKKLKEFIKKSNRKYESTYGSKEYKPKEIIKLGNLTTKMVECWK